MNRAALAARFFAELLCVPAAVWLYGEHAQSAEMLNVYSGSLPSCEFKILQQTCGSNSFKMGNLKLRPSSEDALDEDAVFPFEFHLIGTPVSLQGKAASKDRWKNAVADAARQRIAEAVEWTYLQPEPLALTIYYFPIAPMGGDIDNIIKPIMDALIGVVYLDDKVVERVTVQKFEPVLAWEFSKSSEQLTIALNTVSTSADPIPVVYVHIANDLSWRRL